MESSEHNFTFTSSTATPESTASEINDLKTIVLAIALKLDPSSRKQLIAELSEVDNKPMQEWVANLKQISRD
jgi:hypothetical protein